MMRKSASLLLLLPMFVCLQASAQTLDEVIAKNIAAHGGAEKMKAVKSIKMTGKVIFGGGIEAPATMSFKRPKSVRLEITVQGKSIVQSYDGDTAWAINPFQGSGNPEKMAAEESEDFKENADFDGPLVDYKSKGYEAELIGKEDVEGTEAYKLKLTQKNGNIQYVYIDAQSHLELKITSKRKRQGNEIEIDNYYSDYKTVNGLVLAHTQETKIKGQTVAQYSLDKIELDVPIEDSIFKMPAAK